MIVRMITRKDRVDEAVVLDDEYEWLLRYDEHPKWWMKATERMRYKMQVNKMKKLLGMLVDSDSFK